MRHTHPHSYQVGLLWKSDQPVAHSFTKHKRRTSMSSARIELGS